MKMAFFGMLLTVLIGVHNAMARDRSIQVQGECEKKLLADRASVQITVEIREKNLDKATAKMTEKYNQLQKEIKELKLKDMELKTTHYQVAPEYNWANNKREFLGYLANMGLQIETSEINRLPLALSIATDLGIGNVGNLNTFLSSELMKKEYRSCLDEALKDAESKAKVMAKAVGLDLGKAVSVIEGAQHSDNHPVPIHAVSLKSMDMGSAPEISPSKETFKTQVTAVFELK